MSFKVYPVQKVEPFGCDYRVMINGSEVELNTARVSAMPFNRRWPGHQRSIDQTEAVQFLSMETDGAVDFEIIPREPFEAVRIRPASLGIVPLVKDGVIRITLERPAYFTVEPYGRHRALHIFADGASDYRGAASGPDTLYFGAGEHDVGLIEMKSGQTLFIDEGAVVYANVHASDATGIRILGRGILDNSRNREEILYEANAINNTQAVTNVKRRHTVQLEYCSDVLIDGITVRDSLVYNIRPVACENVEIRNVKIIGCWRYNSDGIDMHNCRNVHIDGCFIRTFDDCICIKGFDCFYSKNIEAAVKAAMCHGGRVYDTFDNVLVENCVLWNDWGKCLEIGAETKAEEICNITFKSCDVIHITHHVLDVCNIDWAHVHDISYCDINIECDERLHLPALQKSDEDVYFDDPAIEYRPNTMAVTVAFHPEYSKGSEGRRGRTDSIRFDNIRFFSDQPPKLKCDGYDPDHGVKDVVISGLTHNGKPVTGQGDITLEIGEFCDNIRFL